MIENKNKLEKEVFIKLAFLFMLFSGTLNLITYVMSEYTRNDIKKISKTPTCRKINKDSVYYEEKVYTLFRTKDYQIIIRTFEPRTR